MEGTLYSLFSLSLSLFIYLRCRFSFYKGKKRKLLRQLVCRAPLSWITTQKGPLVVVWPCLYIPTASPSCSTYIKGFVALTRTSPLLIVSYWTGRTVREREENLAKKKDAYQTAVPSHSRPHSRKTIKEKKNNTLNSLNRSAVWCFRRKSRGSLDSRLTLLRVCFCFLFHTQHASSTLL